MFNLKIYVPAVELRRITVHVKYPLTLCLHIYTDVQTAFVDSLLRAKAVNVGHEDAACTHFLTFVYMTD